VTDKHKIQRVRFIFTIEQLLKIKELYNEKKTESEIAKHFNCGRYKISEELKKMNLK
jgi:DNA-binding transcriptional regulator LsrR (DeoR family)